MMIDNWVTFPLSIKQKDLNYGCIPTNIESVIKYYKPESEISEEKILMEIREKFDETIRAGKYNFNDIIQLPTIILFKESFDFNVISEPKFTGWFEKIKEHIDKSQPPIISVRLTANESEGPHAVTVLGYEKNQLEIYNPDPIKPSDIIQWDLDFLSGIIIPPDRERRNHDMLIIAPKI